MERDLFGPTPLSLVFSTTGSSSIKFRRVIIRALVMLLFLWYEQCAFAQASGNIQLTLESRDYRVVPDRSGEVTIEMEGFGATTSPGDPILPYRIYDAALPPDADETTVRLEVTLTTESIPGAYAVRAAPPQHSDPESIVNWGPGKQIANGRNINTYRRDHLYPAQGVRLVAHSRMRKWRFVRIGFVPIQYNPMRKSLLLVKRAEVRVVFNLVNRIDSKSVELLRDRQMDDVAQNRFVNFETAKGWYPAPSPPPPPASDYVIITTEDIKNNSAALADFVTHKRSLGFSPRIVTELDYGTLTGQSPDGTAEKIRQWLMDHYVSDGIKWVLLIGDPTPANQDKPGSPVGAIPMEMCWPIYKGDADENVPTDYFYADLTGNWDLDGDGRYCEQHTAAGDDPKMSAVNFSVRWSGQFQVTGFALGASGPVRFRTQTDDGVRLWIDSNLVIDNWNDHGPTWDEKTLQLADGFHSIKMEYYQHEGGATARLMWDLGGSEVVVPSTSLYHQASSGTWEKGGLDGSYYAGTDFQQPAFSRVDSNIDFTWDEGQGGPAMPRAPLSVRWTGKLRVALEGDYTFETLSDDGVRLWIDNLSGPAIIDQWPAHSLRWDSSQPVHLPVGDHDLQMDFTNAAADAIAELAWSYNLAPFGNMNGDQFSVRWSGEIQADVAGTYHFKTSSDDGIRMWIDGDAIIDDWNDHGPTDDEKDVEMTSGPHAIKIEYYEHGGGAVARLYWTTPGGTEAIVPADHLLQDSGSGTFATGGLKGQYYQWSSAADPFPANGLKNQRIDPTIDFEWGNVNRADIPKEELFHGSPAQPGIAASYYQGTNFDMFAWTTVESQINLYLVSGDLGAGGIDLTPEVFVGRIPVYNNDYAQLDHILQKIVNYESATVIPDWRRNLLIASVPMFGSPSAYEIGEQLRTTLTAPVKLGTYRIYESDFGLNPPPECPKINPADATPGAPCNMVQQLEAGGGYGTVGWTTHGSPNSAVDLIDTSQAAVLDDTKSFFTFQGSCLNGQPEQTDNLGYSLLENGAIATTAASRISFFDGSFQLPPNPTDSVGESMAYHYLTRVLQGIPAGEALYQTKADDDLPNGLFNNLFGFNLYGDPSVSLLKPYSAAPVDLMLVLDQSGSMAQPAATSGSDKKIDVLHSAANQFLDMLDAGGANQLGLIGFSTKATTEMSLAPFTAATRSTALGQVNALQPNGVTSIGDALDRMVTEFKNHGKEGHRRVALLVTDGMENTAPMIAQVHNEVIEANVPVYSLGFGESYSLDETRLTQLANDTGGDFRFTSDDLLFHKYFLEVLAGAGDWSVAADPTYTLSSGQTITVPVSILCGDTEAVFTAYWAEKDDAIHLTLRAPDGTTYSASAAEYVARKRYSLFRIELPAKKPVPYRGTWTMNVTSLAAGTVRVSASAFVRSSTRMAILEEPSGLYPNKSATLRVRLTDNGVPLRGARVIARYDKPARSFGNVVRENRAVAPVPKVSGTDLSTPLQRKIAALEKKVGGRLIPTQSGEIVLYDDGKHSDGAANDGIYAAAFKDTLVPGMYAFRFEASGLNSCGTQLTGSRQWSVLAANRVKVAPERSPMQVRRIRSSETSLSVTPRDAFGNYLGPGHLVQVIVKEEGRESRIVLNDALDGKYSGAVHLSSDMISPKNITLEIDGQKVSP